MAGIPLSRNFAAGKGGSLAGRLFAGTLPRLCGATGRALAGLAEV
jgi:hypothetical protein